MADLKITQLTAYTPVISTDLFPIVDITTSTTKSVAVSALLTSLPNSLISDTDSTDDLGSSAKYWANTYTDKLYLNATATLAGATGGQIDLVGNLYGSSTSIIRSLTLHAYGANAAIQLTNTNDGATVQGFIQSTYNSAQFGYESLSGADQTGLYIGRLGYVGKTHLATIHKPDISTAADLGNILDDGSNNMTIRGTTTHSDNVIMGVAAKGIVLKQGANGKCGTFVANGVTPVTVSNTSIAIADTIVISLNTVGGTVGVQPHVATITAATGFTVVCTAVDTSTYNYAIISNAA